MSANTDMIPMITDRTAAGSGTARAPMLAVASALKSSRDPSAPVLNPKPPLTSVRLIENDDCSSFSGVSVSSREPSENIPNSVVKNPPVAVPPMGPESVPLPSVPDNRRSLF